MQQAPLQPASDTGATASEKGERAKARPRPDRPLPTDRLKMETQIAALRVIGLDSQNGQRHVTSDDIGTRLGIAATTAGLNNGFFVSAGLATKVGKGKYMPETAVIEFARKHSFDPVAAGKLLAPLLRETWFYAEVRQQLAHGPATVNQMIEVLASAAGVGADRKQQLAMILEWLRYGGLINTSDGNVTLLNTDEAPSDAKREPGRINVPKPPTDPESKTATTTEGHDVAPSGEPAVLTFAVSFSATAADLGRLSPEQLSALMSGFAQIAAVKGALQG